MTIVSSGAFIDTLRLYQLLPNDKIAQLSNVARGRCADARDLAKMLGQQGWLTIFQINQILDGHGKDLVIGPYFILDRLGQGGLSQVFKARHSQCEGNVALKIIRPEVMADPIGRQQFLHEMEAMARLDHPNIVQFCDVDQDGELFYFTMEYVEGTDLGKHVDLVGPLPVAQACDFIRQAALGLQHAHERNLVHRDIKPVNIFLTHKLVDGEASDGSGKKEKTVKQPFIKILDWGLAGLCYPKGQSNPELMQSMAKGIVGTADYLSPEQARNHHTVDIRGDIYSLGCTFYYLLTGQPPFPNGTLMQKVLQHRQDKPAPMSSFREDVPENVLGILNRMLAKLPGERFQTPAAVALALAPFTRIAPERLPQICRKPAVAKSANAQIGKDDTPLPSVLGGPGHSLKASRQRNPSPTADTSCPRG